MWRWIGDHALSILAVVLVVGTELWLGLATNPHDDALVGWALFAASAILTVLVAFGPQLDRPWWRALPTLLLAALAAVSAILFVLWALRRDSLDTVVLVLCVAGAAGLLLAPVAAWTKGRQYAALVRYGWGLATSVALGILVGLFRARTDGMANDVMSWTLLAVSLVLCLAAGLVSRWRATPAWFVGFGVLALAVAMLETSTLGWRTIGFTLIAATVLVGVARNATVTTLPRRDRGGRRRHDGRPRERRRSGERAQRPLRRVSGAGLAPHPASQPAGAHVPAATRPCRPPDLLRRRGGRPP